MQQNARCVSKERGQFYAKTTDMNHKKKLLLSGKNKLKALYPFTHRCCSRFTYPGAWFSVSNCKHYKMCLY